jgi:hypothetical protein
VRDSCAKQLANQVANQVPAVLHSGLPAANGVP